MMPKKMPLDERPGAAAKILEELTQEPMLKTQLLGTSIFPKVQQALRDVHSGKKDGFPFVLLGGMEHELAKIETKIERAERSEDEVMASALTRMQSALRKLFKACEPIKGEPPENFGSLETFRGGSNNIGGFD